MISKETFESACANAKIRLEYGGSDFDAINRLLNDLAKIDDISLEKGINLLDMELVNTFREDVARESLSREEVLSTTTHKKAGCVSIPINLREEG